MLICCKCFRTSIPKKWNYWERNKSVGLLNRATDFVSLWVGCMIHEYSVIVVILMVGMAATCDSNL
jgi:hypothetical protein